MKSIISMRIGEALMANGKRQIDLSKETGINKSAISNYVNGKTNPNQENVRKIAKALNVSETWLYGYESSGKEKGESERIAMIGEIIGKLSQCSNRKLSEIIEIMEKEKP